jgi:hypothetical protein
VVPARARRSRSRRRHGELSCIESVRFLLACSPRPARARRSVRP